MILYGRPVAEKIYHKLNQDLAKLKAQGIHPCLTVILVGEDSVSQIYVREKEKVASELGIGFKLYQFPAMISSKKVADLIRDLNHAQAISGVVLQLPLPADFKTDQILKTIDPQKDVDGFQGKYPAPTAQAILEILKFVIVFFLPTLPYARH